MSLPSNLTYLRNGRYAVWLAFIILLVGLPAAVPRGLAERPAGTPFGWGDFDNAFIPENFTNLVAIDAGVSFLLGLQANGTVVASGIELPGDLTNVVAISAGYYFGLALKTDGHVVAWGGFGHVNREAIITPPEWLTNVVAIAAGVDHSVAETSDGYLVAWGNNLFNVINTPLTLTYPRSFTSGQAGSIAIDRDGRLVGWGVSLDNFLNFPVALTNAIQVDAGPFLHAVGLRADGRVFAWGQNDQGQTRVPAGLTNVVQVAAGSTHSLALKADGTVVAWGGGGADYVSVPTNAPRLFMVVGGPRYSIGLTRAPVSRSGPQSLLAAAGTNLALSSRFVSSSPYTAQWRFEGSDLVGATNALLILTNLQGANAGSYTLVASNEFGVQEGAPITVTLTPIAPHIVSDPDSVAVAAGTEAIFRVEARGMEPFQFQWQFNAVDLPGQTNATLRLPAAMSSNDGEYRVVVRNEWGQVVSAPAQLSTGLPRFVKQPQSRLLLAGLDTELRVQAVAPESLAWQWWHNGKPIAGATAPGLPRLNASAEFEGFYFVVASNSFGAVTSRVVQVALRQFPETLPEPSAAVAWGATRFGSLPSPVALTNAVAVAAGVVHGIALKSDGRVAVWTIDPFAADLSPPPDLADVVGVAAGGWHCLALRRDGTVVGWGLRDWDYGQYRIPGGLSNVVEVAAGYAHSLALRADGTVVQWPDPTNVPPGLDRVVAIAAADLTSVALRADGSIWRWEPGSLVISEDQEARRINGVGFLARWDGSSAWLKHTGLEEVPWPESDGPIMEVDGGDPVKFGRTASGRLLMRDAINPFLSAVPEVLVETDAISATEYYAVALTRAPLVWAEPVSLVVTAGEPAQFSVDVRSSTSVNFQWQKGTNLLPNGTKAILEIPAARMTDDGVYRVLISNARTNVVSREIRLTVVGPPEVDGPTNQEVSAGTEVVLAPLILGPRPWRSQWFFRGRALAGATNDVLRIRNVQAAAGGDYALQAVNAYGASREWTVRVTVQPSGPHIETSPSARDLPEGSDLELAVSARGTEPMTFQWIRDGSDLPGETNAVLRRPAVFQAEAGEYLVRVSNGWGSVSSPAARISIYPTSPAALPGPRLHLANAGNPTTLAVAFVGSPPLRFQWYRDDIVLEGETNALLTLAPARTNHSGSFRLAITNELGSDVSQVIQLVVAPGGGPGALVGWGGSEVPAGLGLVQAFDAGPLHSLAVLADGTVRGWGTNSAGELDVPVGLTRVVAVAAGGQFSAGLREDGSVVVWGRPTGFEIAPPTNLPPVTAIAAGSSHLIALLENGQIQTWGSRRGGVIDIPPAVSNVVAIAASGSASLAQRNDGRIITWGLDSPGDSGLTTTNLASVDLGRRFGIGRDAAGLPIPWGPARPLTPASATNLLRVAAGPSYVLGLQESGTVLSWGQAPAGFPRVPSGLSQVIAISAGGSQALALTRAPVVAGPGPVGAVLTGVPLVLEANATGLLPLRYQWLRNGVELDGETNAVLLVSDPAPSHSGDYAVRVTNPWQTVIGPTAVVRMIGPVEFRLVDLDDARLRFFLRMPGLSEVEIQHSPDLVTWQRYQIVKLPAAGTEVEVPLEPGTQFRFVRAVAP